jgi:hypothetical protein
MQVMVGSQTGQVRVLVDGRTHVDAGQPMASKAVTASSLGRSSSQAIGSEVSPKRFIFFTEAFSPTFRWDVRSTVVGRSARLCRYQFASTVTKRPARLA